MCLGCGRSITEIMRWRDTDEADRVMMLRLAQERLAQRGEKTLATKSKFDAE